MTQIGGFWDGTTTGQATLAPYDALEFNKFFSKTIASHGAGFVIPGYTAGDLKVAAQSPASAIVEVSSGAAYVKGFHFESDATETFTIAANASGNPRIDRIVLRADWATKTIALAMIAGTPAATPTPAALTQTEGTTWEVSLAYIWVANGFATIANDEIHDERTFATTFMGVLASEFNTRIVNSEFMAYSNLQAAPPTLAPEGWAIFGTIPTIVSATRPAQMSRGRYLQMTAGGANRGLQQTIPVTPSTPYAFKALMNVTGGDVGAINITTNSGAPVGLTRTIRRTGLDLEETLYYTTEADATTLTIAAYCVNNTDVVKLGQVLAVKGYYPGPFREVSETIYFVGGLTDASWLITAKSSGTTTITLSASFGSFILPGTKAVALRMIGNDSGSAAAVDATMITGVVGGGVVSAIGPSLQLAGLPNDKRHDAWGWIVLNASLQFNIQIIATGALTYDATVYVAGIQT